MRFAFLFLFIISIALANSSIYDTVEGSPVQRTNGWIVMVSLLLGVAFLAAAYLMKRFGIGDVSLERSAFVKKIGILFILISIVGAILYVLFPGILG